MALVDGDVSDAVGDIGREEYEVAPGVSPIAGWNRPAWPFWVCASCAGNRYGAEAYIVSPEKSKPTMWQSRSPPLCAHTPSGRAAAVAAGPGVGQPSQELRRFIAVTPIAAVQRFRRGAK